MIWPQLAAALIACCVRTVESTQAMEQPDHRPLLRRQNMFPEEGERFAPRTREEYSRDMAEEGRAYGEDVPGQMLADRAGGPDGAALYEAHESDASIAKKLATDASARMEEMQKHIDELETKLGKFEGTINKADASRVPTTMDQKWNFHERSLAERVRYLEHKIDGASNWLTDPQLYEKLQLSCKNLTNLGTDHRVCLDNFEQRKRKNCVVYDLGIRANPEFGTKMMSDYGCSVRAYDPSPISKKWWAGEVPGAEQKALVAKLKAAGPEKYDFHNVGAGGMDGPLTLYEYNWNQVSIFHAENDHTQRGGDQPDLPPKRFSLDALTLPTMMRNNKDNYIDVLKLDIEGSEYVFLQDMFDRLGCPPVGQFALEWHAFSNDPRYGSPPEINTLHNLMSSCGYKMFFNHEHWRASAGYATDENGHKTNSNRNLPPMRYALASYCKDCVPIEGQMNSDHEGSNARAPTPDQVS